MILEAENAYDLTKLIKELGRAVTYRDLTVKTGPSPAANPPQLTALVASGAASPGAATINLRATYASGRLIAGDVLTIGAHQYTVGSEIIAASNAFAAVPISPTLIGSVSDGTAVATTFSADHIVTALVTSYPSRMVNGTSILQTDRQVRFLASDLAGLTPGLTDKVLIGGDVYSIIDVKSAELQGVVYSWFCQARR